MEQNIDFTYFFSKNYNKPPFKEEKEFKHKYISVENIAKNILKTDIKRGLNMSDKNDIEWRKKVFGINEYFSSSEKTSLMNFLNMSLEDPIIMYTFIISIILMIIDIINEGIKTGYQEGLSIIISLLIYIILTAYRDLNSKNKTIEYDKIKKEKKCKVIRNNKEQIISNWEILVGDILVLKKGDIVEVDGFFTEEKNIGVDESSIFQGENKYKIKYKSNKFIQDNKEDYICPFIFAGTYVVEGSGYMIVAQVGKNIYKNNTMIKEIMTEKLNNLNNLNDENENENENNNNNKNMEIKNEEEIDEYINNYGYYKILISAFSEQISSIGIYFYMILGFIIIIKKTVIRLKEGKNFMTLDEVDIFINGILVALIGSIFSMINSLFMIDLIGFLSDDKRMKKNNISFKYEKYAELAFVDTLIFLDNKRELIPGDNNNIETSKIMRNIKNYGINIIYLSEKNIDDTILYAKEIGIIDDYEIEQGKKILKKHKNLLKQSLLVIQENPIFLEGGIFYSLCGEVKKEIRKSGNEKITISNLDNFKKIIYNLKIISNIRKQDKLLLINGFKQLGKIIAVTGNNLEDLQLMKLANISVGNNNNNDILKENYSLTLLDNSFNSFWNACIYSTNLIYKILQYLIFFVSTFFIILIVNAIGIFIFRDIPINLIQMIYIICIVDIISPPGVVEGNFCYKFLTYDKYSKNIPLINNKVLDSIALHIGSRVIIIAYLMFYGNTLFNFESDKQLEHNMWNDNNGYHITAIFCVLFFMILIHLTFIIIETNKNFIQFGFNICILVIMQLWINNYGGKITRTKPLNQNDLIKCFGVASIAIPVDLICKIIINYRR